MNAASAALATLYTASSQYGCTAFSEVMQTSRPQPRLRMAGTVARAMRTVVKKSVSQASW